MAAGLYDSPPPLHYRSAVPLAGIAASAGAHFRATRRFMDYDAWQSGRLYVRQRDRFGRRDMTSPAPFFRTTLALAPALLFDGAPWVRPAPRGLPNKPADIVPCASCTRTPRHYLPAVSNTTRASTQRLLMPARQETWTLCDSIMGG